MGTQPTKQVLADVLSMSAEDLLALAKFIIDKYQQDSTTSLVKVQVVADLSYKTALAKAKHEEGKKYQKLMEVAFAERDSLVGQNQESFIGGGLTIKGVLAAIYSHLCDTDHGMIKEWGFKTKDSAV